ncbi:MAG: DUF1990 family protein [Verrucomicrobia bacterium]|nr:DUF1990 family protein [Verrucomicrobiota bacterium]
MNVRSLAEARRLAPNFADARRLPERRSVIALDVAGPIRRWQTDFLFAYDIFPPEILVGAGEWQEARRPMAVGDHLLQRVWLPPRRWGVSLHLAVRICALFDDADRLGFAYETLTGHPERGVAEFSFREVEGRLQFEIRTFSEPSLWLARLTGPMLVLPYQAWCTRRALEHVRRRFREVNRWPPN